MKYKHELRDKSKRSSKANLTRGAFGKRKEYSTFDPSETNHERVLSNRGKENK